MNVSAENPGPPVAFRLSSARSGGVDVCRLIAIFAVICIHTKPFGVAHFLCRPPRWIWLNFFLIQATRFAVPFFFSISGYFWGRKIWRGVSVVEASFPLAKRLISIFCFWCVIYLLPWDVSTISSTGLHGLVRASFENLRNIFHHPLGILFAGDAPHLWFLPALLCSLGISAFFASRHKFRLLYGCAVALYAIGLLAGAYAETPIGFHLSLGHLGFNTRNGPFFGTVFFAFGCFLSRLTPRTEWFRWGLALYAFGLVMQCIEMYFLSAMYPSTVDRDYVIGTICMGIGVTLMAVSNHRFLDGKLIARLGRYTLGIYCVHYIFVELLDPLAARMHSPLGEFAYPVAVLFLSLATVLILARFRTTLQFVQ